MDRLTSEALEGLCTDCPVREWAGEHFTGELSDFIDDDDLPAEIGAEDAETAKLGIQVATTMNLVAALILREELGCDGAVKCEDCETPHCGAMSLIHYEINLELETATEEEE